MNDFDSYKNPAEFWLKKDALRSLDFDLYFSLGKRYYCDAGCKVCYIADNLKQTKNLDIYDDDLEKYHNEWFTFFEYFGTIRTNDDLYYFKYKKPKQYEWYLKYGENFELCITDNAIFRLLKIPEMKLKSVGDITLSTLFLETIGVEKVLDACKELYSRYGVKKIKYIDCGNPEIFKDVIEWVKENNLADCLHHDFRTNHREVFAYDWVSGQSTWITHNDGKVVQVYRESIHLYYDRFYFSSDEASDLDKSVFYSFSDKININEFVYGLVNTKKEVYGKLAKLPLEKIFIDYYNATQNFNVNPDFNFIPRYMFPPTAKFFYEMEKLGWQHTKYGLYLNDGNDLKPLVERAKL